MESGALKVTKKHEPEQEQIAEMAAPQFLETHFSNLIVCGTTQTPIKMLAIIDWPKGVGSPLYGRIRIRMAYLTLKGGRIYGPP